MVVATVSTLKPLVERSQSVLRSNICPLVQRNACSELSLMVEDPTIIQAALVPPRPVTPLAWLVAPPSVPKSVTV